MLEGLIGKKLGMIQLFSEDGGVTPVTVIAAGFERWDEGQSRDSDPDFLTAADDSEGTPDLFDSLRAELWADGIAVTVLVLGAVRTGVSANAMRGDGSKYGRINRIQAEGMSVERCAARILDAVARRRQEVMIASLAHRLMVWRSHFFPRLAARALRLKPRHRTRA